MMKQLLTVLFFLILILGFSLQAQADLFNRGSDSAGNRLIYDSDRNITWYDYANSYTNWWNQMAWASQLTVNFDGTIYDDWRLPSTVPGSLENSWDGSTSVGYNITSSELGHLFYTELGNTVGPETSACYPGCIIKQGPFLNIDARYARGYWSSTEVVTDPNSAYVFAFDSGGQSYGVKSYGVVWGLAVRSGDVLAPEPISSILFLTGGATLIGRKYLKRKKIEI